MTADLTTNYMGLELANPLVAAASPLTGTLDGLLALEEAGAGAVVLQSLFEEQIEHHELAVNSILETANDSFPEVHNFFPGLDDYNTGPESYLQLVEGAKAQLTIPVIGSLNGISIGGWTRYARLIEEAGADALELNIYFVAADARTTSAEVEARYVDLVGEVAELDLDPARRQGGAVLLVARQHGAAAFHRRGAGPGALQPLPLPGHLAPQDEGGAHVST